MVLKLFMGEIWKIVIFQFSRWSISCACSGTHLSGIEKTPFEKLLDFWLPVVANHDEAVV